MDIKCPACHAYLDDDEDLTIGEIIYCAKCFQDFEVVKIKPVKLRPIKSWTSDEEGVEDNFEDDDFYE